MGRDGKGNNSLLSLIYCWDNLISGTYTNDHQRELSLTQRESTLCLYFPQRTSWKEIFNLIGKGPIADPELHQGDCIWDIWLFGD